jgi:ABC-type iron transport system FetAB permease component
MMTGRFWRVPLAEAVEYQILVMFLLKNGTPQVLSA